jgi:hypothetical protein
MKQATTTEFGAEVKSKLHTDLLNYFTQLVDSSRSVMSGYYEQWDKNLAMYDSKVPPRKVDQYAKEEQRPKSQTIPMSWAQVQVWKAYASQLLGQKEYQFEHQSTGIEDEAGRDLADKLLHNDLMDNKWEVQRGQFLTNLGIFSVGVIKIGWEQQEVGLSDYITTTTGTGSLTETSKQKGDVPLLMRMGNELKVISPFNFFPDPACGLAFLDKARFVACEVEMTRHELKMLEHQGKVAGVDYVRNKFSDERWQCRRFGSRLSSYRHEEVNQNDIIVVTELQVKVIPSMLKMSDGTPYGNSDKEKIVVVWIANDDRIIRIEDYDYVHCGFGYVSAVLDPEQHEFVRKSFINMSEDLQATMDWYMNAKVEGQTRNIEPQLVVDPYAVDLAAVMSGQRVIPMKKGAARAGIDRFIKQLQTTDPTARNMSDINDVMKLMQITSGVNDNMLGQYSSGRRSATEARVVAGGTAARASTMVREIWTMALNPLGIKCSKTLRAELTREYAERVVGKIDDAVWKAYAPGRQAVAISRDYFMTDSTSPSEKGFMAQSLQELLGMILSNPENAVTFDLSPKLILEKIMELRGLKFAKNFSVQNDPQLLQQLIMQQAQAMAQQMVQQYVLQLQQQQNPAGNTAQA